MTMARAKWRAVSGRTAFSIAPSRRCTCQSSGRRMVRVSVMSPGLAATHSSTPAARRAAFLSMCGGGGRKSPPDVRGALRSRAARLISGAKGDPMLDAAPVVMQRARGRAAVTLSVTRGATRLERLHQSGSAKAFLPRIRPDAGGGVPQHGRGPHGRRPLRLFRPPRATGASATLTTQTAERAYRSAGGGRR